MLARDYYPPPAHGGAPAGFAQHDDGVVAIEIGDSHTQHHARHHGGGASELPLFNRDYEVNGRRVRLIPVDHNKEPLNSFAGSTSVQMAILALEIIILLFMIVGACICWFYIYPQVVELMDDKIKNVGELAINLAQESVGPLVETIECVIGRLGDSVNDALGPLLGTEIDFGGTGDTSLFAMCPISFAGINHTISSATMDEVLGSSFETSAPSFRSQLHDLKYGAGSSAGSSEHHSYAPIHYFSGGGSSESPSSETATDGD